MKDITIIAPVKTPEDIENFIPHTKCRDFYVYYHKFLHNFDYINEFIDVAHKNECKIYINFKHDISEEDLVEIKKMIKYLKTAKIDGFFINSFAILEAIKVFSLPFKVIIDSYFDIHNLSGIDFVNTFHQVDEVIITEEIYMKNITKIKKYTNLALAIDSDNLPWCAEDLKKLKVIDNVVIKGKFSTSDEILEGIELVEKILDKPKMFKNQKLPFKHLRKSIYRTNHFSGEMLSAQGKDFKFSRNIQKFDWGGVNVLTDTKEHSYHCEGVNVTKFKKDNGYKTPQDFRINLRLVSLDQLKQVKNFIKKLGFNPIYSIEYGEILSTADLAKKSFNQVIDYVKKFCFEHGIKLQLSTPRVLIERDFDRVYEYVKGLCLQELAPSSLIVNNIGYFWAVVNDTDLNHIPIEIGQGINLLNSMSIKCLNNIHPLDTVDFTTFGNMEETVKKVKDIIENKKYTIAGNIRIPSLGLCPLNNDSAIISRLSCKAPCHKGEFALRDPSLNKIIPFTVDGFCRMHMFEDKILEEFDKIDHLTKVGINEFVFDFSALPPKFVPILLTNFFNRK